VLEKIGQACSRNLDCRNEGLDCVKGFCHCSLETGYKVGEARDCTERSILTDFLLLYMTGVIVIQTGMTLLNVYICREYGIRCGSFSWPPEDTLPCTRRRRNPRLGRLQGPVICTLINQMATLTLCMTHWLSVVGIDPHETVLMMARPICAPIALLSMGLGCSMLGVAWIETAFRFLSNSKLKDIWGWIKRLFFYVAVPLFVLFSTLITFFKMIELFVLIPMVFNITGMAAMMVGAGMLSKAASQQTTTSTQRLQHEIGRVKAATTRITLSFVLLFIGAFGFSTYVSRVGLTWLAWHFQVLFLCGVEIWIATILSIADHRRKLPFFLRFIGGQATLSSISYTTQTQIHATAPIQAQSPGAAFKQQQGDVIVCMANHIGNKPKNSSSNETWSHERRGQDFVLQHR